MENTQGLEFKNVDEFLDFLNEEELEIVLFLRRIILECMPDCKEKVAYNVPFYYRHSRICYIWPASVPCRIVEKGVAIGFCKGASFLDDTFETTKFASKQTFNGVKEIDVALLKQQLHDAIIVDDQIVKARRRKIQ